MLTCFSIIVGILLAFVCVKKGIFPSWAIFVNVVIAVYAAVMSAPYFLKMISGGGVADDFSYHVVVAMVTTAGMIFAVLQIIATIFITGNYVVTFPKIFGHIASGVFGFAAGKIIASFLILILCITPLAAKPAMARFNLRSEEPAKELTSLIYMCNFMSSASLQGRTGISKDIQ
jgi:hypothetical protein